MNKTTNIYTAITKIKELQSAFLELNIHSEDYTQGEKDLILKLETLLQDTKVMLAKNNF